MTNRIKIALLVLAMVAAFVIDVAILLRFFGFI